MRRSPAFDLPSYGDMRLVRAAFDIESRFAKPRLKKISQLIQPRLRRHTDPVYIPAVAAENSRSPEIDSERSDIDPVDYLLHVLYPVRLTDEDKGEMKIIGQGEISARSISPELILRAYYLIFQGIVEID